MADPFSHATLVLGGARSGKSLHAETLAQRCAAEQGADLVYVATSQIFDDEMKTRVEQHAARRGSAWRLIEEPLNLRDVLASEASASQVILVDCLTLWLSNLMHHERDVAGEGRKLADMLAVLPGWTILVSNEVGFGIVPENRLARAFRDHQGRLNQEIAAVADRVDFVAAGLPLTLKPHQNP